MSERMRELEARFLAVAEANPVADTDDVPEERREAWHAEFDAAVRAIIDARTGTVDGFCVKVRMLRRELAGVEDGHAQALVESLLEDLNRAWPAFSLPLPLTEIFMRHEEQLLQVEGLCKASAALAAAQCEPQDSTQAEVGLLAIADAMLREINVVKAIADEARDLLKA